MTTSKNISATQQMPITFQHASSSSGFFSRIWKHTCDIFILVVSMIGVGPSISLFRYRINRSRPLDHEKMWHCYTKTRSGPAEWFHHRYPFQFMVRLVRWIYYRRSTRFIDHASGIADHYDFSDSRFYEQFLDTKYLSYSAGDFLRDTDTVEQAQENKLSDMIRLIDPQPHEKILDLGPGWGGLMEKINEKTDRKDNLYGYTLSKEQIKYTTEKYGFNIEYRDFINTDYEPHSFDKIVSNETLEHVREHELPVLSKKLARALKPGGRIVHQFFCQFGDIPPQLLVIAGLFIFPGSELAPFKVHMKSFEQADLRVTHHAVLDYRPTLLAWRQRLIANRQRVLELVGKINYNKYLLYLTGAWKLFDDRELILNRVVLEHRN